MSTPNSDSAIVFTVDDFCKSHRISRAGFYRLMKRGNGPRVMRVGSRTLISSEAATDWRRSMEAGSAAYN